MHDALAEPQDASLHHRRRPQRGPIIGFGAPCRLSEAFDVEPNLRYHQALV
jgi:hypothetical protein